MFYLDHLLPSASVWSWCVGARVGTKKLPQLLPPQQRTWPLITLEQTHGNQVAVITQAATQQITTCDAALTYLPQVILSIKSADCLPILLSHSSGLIGAVHAGRRGTEQEILCATLEKAKELGASGGSWQIWFGPAICRDCYEINHTTQAHFDLQAQNRHQLETALPDHNYTLSIESGCTLEHPDHWYSYRRTGSGTPMNYSCLASV